MEVVFLKSGVTARWDDESVARLPVASLLELAEFHGIELKNGCRSGMCGVCPIRIVAGEVEYPRPTLAEPPEGCALVCKAVPKAAAPEARLVLDA